MSSITAGGDAGTGARIERDQRTRGTRWADGMLDRNKDGSVVDDIAGYAGKILGR